MTWLTLHGGIISEPSQYQWPSNCCGLTISRVVPKKTPYTAGKGLRVIEGGPYPPKESTTFNRITIETKNGPFTILSKHLDENV